MKYQEIMIKVTKYIFLHYAMFVIVNVVLLIVLMQYFVGSVILGNFDSIVPALLGLVFVTIPILVLSIHLKRFATIYIDEVHVIFDVPFQEYKLVRPDAIERIDPISLSPNFYIVVTSNDDKYYVYYMDPKIMFRSSKISKNLLAILRRETPMP